MNSLSIAYKNNEWRYSVIRIFSLALVSFYCVCCFFFFLFFVESIATCSIEVNLSVFIIVVFISLVSSFVYKCGLFQPYVVIYVNGWSQFRKNFNCIFSPLTP